MKYTFKDRKKYFAEVEAYLKKNLKPARYRHTIGVAHTAACMAMRYNLDIDKAYIAGLFHDCAKSLSDEQTLKLVKKYRIKLSDFEKNNLYIIHGKVGAELAKNEFDIVDEELLDGIRYHTTGRPDMSLFEKVIYLADFIETNRDTASDLSQVRALCFVDIDAALYRVLCDMLPYLTKNNTPIDDTTRQTYEFYDKILDEKTKKLAFNSIGD